MSQKFLQSEKLQTEVSFSFITFNNILILIIPLFQAPEKVKIGVKVVFLDVNYIPKIIVGTMLNPFSVGPAVLRVF